MLLQSTPGGGTESNAVFTNLNNTATMTAYFNDLKLFFQKAGAFPVSEGGAARRAGSLGLHGAAVDERRRPDRAREGGGNRDAGAGGPAEQRVRLCPRRAQAPRRVRTERRRRLPHQRLGNQRRHRAVEPLRRDGRRARRACRRLLRLARRQLRHRVRRVQRPGLGLLPVRLRRQRPILVGRGGLPTQHALSGRLLGRRGKAHRDVADSAGQHEDAGAEQHHRSLSGQPSGVAARRSAPHAPRRLSRRWRRRLPLRRRSGRHDVRLQRSERRRHESGRHQRQHARIRSGGCGVSAGGGDARHHTDARHALRGRRRRRFLSMEGLAVPTRTARCLLRRPSAPAAPTNFRITP